MVVQKIVGHEVEKHLLKELRCGFSIWIETEGNEAAVATLLAVLAAYRKVSH